MAGGARAGRNQVQTGDFCYNCIRDPVHFNDLNATNPHAMGIDHQRFTFQYQGLE